MTAVIRVLVYQPGENVDTGSDAVPIRARVLRAQVLLGGAIRYELGWWRDETWCTGWFPGSEVRAVEGP